MSGQAPNRQYCEGEICAGGGEDFLQHATDATIPVLVDAARLWATECKQPDTPCQPKQCDQWCHRSQPLDHGHFTGACQSDSVSGNCECKCSPPGQSSCAAATTCCAAPPSCSGDHYLAKCPDNTSRCCSVNMVCCNDGAAGGAIGCELQGFCQ